MKLLFIFLLSFAAYAEPAADITPNALDQDNIEHFLKTLEGAWEGRAIRTPVGQRPYDILFERGGEDIVKGKADPGAAIHHWMFYRDQGALKLRFLSTFQGNRQPLLLTAKSLLGDAALFQAPSIDYLLVQVRPLKDTLWIQVFLRGELHVEIRLERQEIRSQRSILTSRAPSSARRP